MEKFRDFMFEWNKICWEFDKMDVKIKNDKISIRI